MKVSRIQETAYHEAAHAFLALRYGLHFEGIEILATQAKRDGKIEVLAKPLKGNPQTPKISKDGTTRAGNTYGVEPLTPHNIESSIVTLLGGPAVKQIITPSCKGFLLSLSGPASDMQDARDICRIWWGLEGVKADRHIQKMLRGVKAIIQEHWDIIVKIGDALLTSRNRRLSRRQVIRLAGGVRKVRRHHVKP